MNIWRNITEHYLVNESGDVLSTKTGKIIKQHLDHHGYMVLKIRVNGKYRSVRPHREVAIAFIANPENKETVNHKNGIKIDNRAENLEWMTTEENNQHAVTNGLNNAPGATHPKSIPISQHSKDGELVAQFGSMHEAARVNGFSAACISLCCNGKINFYKGFVWKIKPVGIG